MKLNKIYCLLLVLMLLSLGVTRGATIQVIVPTRVSCGENFQLRYVIQNADVESFRGGNVSGGLEIIAGPYTSTQSSIQIVNGHTSKSSSVTYTYTLYASKNGTFTISSARATINGKQVTSAAAKVTVTGSAPKASAQQQAPRMHEDYDETQMRKAGSRITGKDLFVQVTASKHKVYEQEPVYLTYKVCTLVECQVQAKMPDLNGFHIQEIPIPQPNPVRVEKIGGRNYRTIVTNQYVMYPQMTGKLSIPALTFKGTVMMQDTNVDPLEAWLNGGSGYVEVQRNVQAPAVNIEVLPLPQKPAGFSGGVGQFSVSMKANKQKLKAGEPLTLSVIVSGKGNLKLLKVPVLDLPKDFDKYDPKTTDHTQLTASGLEGNMQYDYLVVPRNQGTFTIPGIKFIYFDTATASYKTITTQPVVVTVGKGDGKSSMADFAKENDIRDLHKLELRNSGTQELSNSDTYFLGSTGFWMWIVLPLVVFLVLVYVFRKRAQRNANIVLMRGRRANKVATKRLRKAARLMAKGQQMEFYDEVLRALWGYVSDKLNIPVVELSRDNITERLTEKNISDETIKKFLAALDECEYARYAPGDPKGKMDTVYDKAATAITEINSTLKK